MSDTSWMAHEQEWTLGGALRRCGGGTNHGLLTMQGGKLNEQALSIAVTHLSDRAAASRQSGWLKVVDLRQVPATALDKVLQSLIDNELRRPFGVAGEGWWRVLLLALGKERSVLILCVDPAVGGIADVSRVAADLRHFYGVASGYQEPGGSNSCDVEVVALPSSPDGERRASRDLDETYPCEALLPASVWVQPPPDSVRRETVRRCQDEIEIDLGETSFPMRALASGSTAGGLAFAAASFGVVLARFTYESEVSVDVPLQTGKSECSPAGPEVHVPVTISVPLDATLGDCLAQVRRTIDGLEQALSCGAPNLPDVVTSQPAPPVVLHLDFAPKQALPLFGLTSLASRWVHGGPPCNIEIALRMHGPSEIVTLAWDSEVWSRTTMQQLADAWRGVIATMAEDLGILVGARPLSSGGDLRELPRSNGVQRRNLTVASLQDLVEHWASDTPHAPAIEDGARQLTYAELDRRAQGLAKRLANVGVGTDDVVGVCGGRSADLIVSMLAVLKAGGAYLPLNQDYPEDRLRLMLEDAGARAIVLADDRPAWGDLAPLPMLALERDEQLEPRGGTATRAHSSRPESLACVVYTSGSTGRPKAVGVPHCAVVRLVHQPGYLRLAPGDVVLNLGDPSFDITTLEVWGALCAGALVRILPDRPPAGPEEVLRALADRPTVVCLTGMLFNQVVDRAPAAFLNVPYVFVVGEVMDTIRTRAVLHNGAPLRLMNGYGPTENTTFSTCHELKGFPPDAPSVPIGTAVPDTTLHVLDRWFHPVPAGAIGELYLGGRGVARGYLGQPARTAERFLPEPFSGEPGGRMYCTGDLVRRRPDGVLEYYGRKDRQLKIRGYRVEPGEVEGALLDLPGVKGCTVQMFRVGDDPRLVAYIVPSDPPQMSPARILSSLRRRLPPHLIPSHLVLLEALPRTRSGKLDVLALPGPESAERVLDTDPVLPRTPTETLLWEIWAEILGQRAFGVEDDFFVIGGHSLLATTLVAHVQDRMNATLSLREVFQYPTVAGLGRLVDDRPLNRESPIDELVAAVRGSTPVDALGESLDGSTHHC
jgi:amino acid adenylation domain-containing protein